MVKELQFCTKTRLPSLTQHTMIVVWLGDSVNEYRAKYLQLLDQVTLRCPICSSECGSHGWYSRKVRLEEEATRIPVLRVRCRGCKKTHVVLPDFLAPHKQYTQQIREAALQACLEENVPVEQATQGSRAVVTTRRWLREFKARFNELAGALISVRVRISPWSETRTYRRQSKAISTLYALSKQVCSLLGGQIGHSSVLGLVNQIVTIGGLKVWF